MRHARAPARRATRAALAATVVCLCAPGAAAAWSAPGEQSSGVPALSVAGAARSVPAALDHTFGPRFDRSSLTQSCDSAGEQVRCQVAWTRRPYRFVGTVTMWSDPADPLHFLVYRTSIARIRVTRGASRRLAAAAASLRPARGGRRP